MKSFLIMNLLCAAMAFAVVGCVPAKPTLPTPPEDAAGDNRSLSAERMATMIAAQEKHVVALGDSVMLPVGLARNVEALQEIEKVKEMKEAFGKALTTLHVLDEATIYLEREVRHSEAAYQGGVLCYEARSRDYSDEKLRTACLSFATHYSALRDAVPTQRKRIADLRAELPTTLVVMRQSGQILDDYYLFLVNNPNSAKSPTLTRDYVEAIKTYVQRFQAFESALAQYRGDKGSMASALKYAGRGASK